MTNLDRYDLQRFIDAQRASYTRAVNELKAGRKQSHWIDDLKFHSSMTLFAHAAADNQIFLDALKIFFRAEFDGATLARALRF